MTKENHLTLQDSGCTGQDSNHEPLEYKSEASPLETNIYEIFRVIEYTQIAFLGTANKGEQERLM